MCFYISVIYSSALIHSFYIFLLDHVLTVFIHLSSKVSIFIIITLILTDKLLVTIFFFFLVIFKTTKKVFIFYIVIYFSVISFCLIVCVYIYVLILSRSVSFLNIGEVALYRTQPMDPSNGFPLASTAWCSRSTIYVVAVCLSVLQGWLLWPYWLAGMAPAWLTLKLSGTCLVQPTDEWSGPSEINCKTALASTIEQYPQNDSCKHFRPQDNCNCLLPEPNLGSTARGPAQR